MGGVQDCCGSRSTYGIEENACKPNMEKLRAKYGQDVLIMTIKDQNRPGKLCLSGDVGKDLAESLLQVLRCDPNNRAVRIEMDKYDAMWDLVFRETSLTTGHALLSMAKSYFPRGRLIVALLDALAGAGWALSACPNFGGVESRDDNGKAASCVDWPVFVFYRDEGSSRFAASHLMLAVKDSNVPGKLCAAGPVGEMEAAMAEALRPFAADVRSERDSYDDDYDVVWRNTSITSGMQAMSFAKAYFPKGQTNVALLQCAYSFGWRAVAAPNFGGQGDSWPCVVLRKLASAEGAPELLFASLKDSNVPGKLCFAGPAAGAATAAVCAELSRLEGNADVRSEKDSYDDDYDAVARNVRITNGMAAFSLRLPYFPRCDAVTAVLRALSAQGFALAACPNFGGNDDSWASFILEKSPGTVPETAFLAIKDDNIPGKVCIGGGDTSGDPSLGDELLEVLRILCGPRVERAPDDYDRTFDLAFRHTVVTSGHATFTFAKPYFPHGFVVEGILQVLRRHGWQAVGGPNFGSNGDQWPGIVLQRVRAGGGVR